MKIKMTRGKFEGLNACSNEQGVIAALAVDHRLNLLQAIARAGGENGQADVRDMRTFKAAITEALTPYASAILLDPVYGLEAIGRRAPMTGVMLAYEQSGYDNGTGDRLPDLLPEWSVRRLVAAGARAIKILLYYNPFDAEHIKTCKQAYIERIGAECRAIDVPFFLEPIVYDNALGSEREAAFMAKKPLYVARVMEEFSHERYGIDILKVELPFNPAFVAGMRAAGEQTLFTRQEAIGHLQATAEAAKKPFIYLSAGVTDAAFCEMLELAAEAGVRFAGVLCGRATWQDGISIYARQGLPALNDWLAQRGIQNIQAINRVLAASAVPWWDAYGGRENIEVKQV